MGDVTFAIEGTMFHNMTVGSHQNFSASRNMKDFEGKMIESFRKEVGFFAAVVIACSSPMAVEGNAFILAAVWRKTSVRTSFYFLLSGFALTDFLTGLIAQPFFLAASLFMDAKNLTVTQDNQLLVDVIDVITVSSAAFFISITLVTITVMAFERCLFMSPRSLMITHRRNFIAIAIILFPIPSITIYFFASLRIFRMMMMAEISLCYLVT